MKFRSREPDLFALCLCAAGMAWRCDQNAGRLVNPMWHLWAAREQIEHGRIGPIEEWHDEDELRAMFPWYRPGDAASKASEDVLLAAGRSRRAKL